MVFCQKYAVEIKKNSNFAFDFSADVFLTLIFLENHT